MICAGSGSELRTEESEKMRERERARHQACPCSAAAIHHQGERGSEGNHNDHSVMMINIDPQISHFCHKTK